MFVVFSDSATLLYLRIMVHPSEFFSRQEELYLGGKPIENLNRIAAFWPKSGKLRLHLEETFDDQSLIHLSETLPIVVDRWKLKNLW